MCDLIQHIRKYSSAKGLDRYLLEVIAGRHSPTGAVWTQIELATEMGVSRITVRRCLERLARTGELAIELRDGRSSAYFPRPCGLALLEGSLVAGPPSVVRRLAFEESAK